MKLYHATSTKHVDSILRSGIVPRSHILTDGDSRNAGTNPENHRDNSTDPDLVYLSSSYCYGGMAPIEVGYDYLIVEVESDLLPEQNFRPDVDLLAEVFKGESEVNLRAMVSARQDLWFDSLMQLGICAYKGVIYVEAFTSCVSYPRIVVPKDWRL